MPKNVPALKPKQLIKLLQSAGCTFYREGKGDHVLFVRQMQGIKRVVPIDMGCGELSPPYVLRILRQFGFTDDDIENILQ